MEALYWQPPDTAPRNEAAFQGWVCRPDMPSGWWEPNCRYSMDGSLETYGRIDYDMDGWDCSYDIVLVTWMPIPTKPTKLRNIKMNHDASTQESVNDCLQTLKFTNAGTQVFAEQFHKLAKLAGWWNDLQTGEPLNRNKGELLCLIHSEISEALEGERKDSMDKHLPNRREAEVELADAVIRIFDYACAFGYDIVGAMVEKAEYNTKRADHKVENRKAEHGKKY